MQDVPHHEHVRRRQRVGEEVAGGEAQALAEPEAGHVVVEDRLERGQVEAAAGDVLVRQGDLNRHGALGAADVDHAAVVAQGNLAAIACPAPALMAVIARGNCASRAGSA